MNRSQSVIAIPPGETIKEQLEDRGMTQKELAARMGLSEKHVSRLVNGKVRLTPHTAELLEKAIEVPARFWLGLEACYRADLMKVEAEKAGAAAKGMTLLEWIQGELQPRLLKDPECARGVLNLFHCRQDKYGLVHAIEA